MPVVEVDYISAEKVVAVDYIAVVNALVHAQRGGEFTAFLSGEIDANFTVKELTVDVSVKKAVVTVDHGWIKAEVAVFLEIRVLYEKEARDLEGNPVKYIIAEVVADRPLQLYGCRILSCNGSRWIVEVREGASVIDSRGLEVRP